MLAATIKKDLQLLARDRGALISLFLLPVVFIAVFGAFFSSVFGATGRLILAGGEAEIDYAAAAATAALEEINRPG